MFQQLITEETFHILPHTEQKVFARGTQDSALALASNYHRNITFFQLSFESQKSFASLTAKLVQNVWLTSLDKKDEDSQAKAHEEPK